MIRTSEVILEETGWKTRKGLPLYRLAKSVRVYDDDHLLLEMEEGFLTDKTSWPPIIWKYLYWIPLFKKWLADKDDKYTTPSIIHDYYLDRTHVPKWECDLRYKHALKSFSVSSLESFILGGAVRTRKKVYQPAIVI